MKFKMNLFLGLVFALFMSACTSENTAGGGQSGTTHKTESGTEYLTYKTLSTEVPTPGDYVFFEVQMRNDSAVIDGTRMRGGQSPRIQIPKEKIEGRRVSPVEEVLKVMGVNDSITIIVHLDTVPVNQRPPGFQNSNTMYYDVICTKIQSQEDYEADLAVEQEKANAAKAILQKRVPEIQSIVAADLAAYKAGTAETKSTPSGLKYIIHEAGSGPKAEAGKNVSVHYYGTLLDGTMFDNSFDRGAPIDFVLGQGQVIPGWDEGLALLNQGAKATLFIPANLAYGDRASGKIPANSELMFYVELEGVK